MSAIVVSGLYKSFGKVQALQGVDLVVPKGKVVGLLGPNGAGKTTLVRILTTLMQPDAGKAEVEGVNVLLEPNEVRRRIGLTGQYAAVDETMTGRENLVMIARLYHLSVDEAHTRAEELLRRFNLEDAADRTLKTYSGGMRRRLDIAASLVNRPPVLFLDEPTTGLDPQSRLELWDIIRELVAGGTTLLLTTQYLEEADRLADTIVVIDHGVVIAEGTPQELKARMGGDILELHLTHAAQLGAAAAALRTLQTGAPQLDTQLSVLRVPVATEPGMLLRAMRALDEAGVVIEDLQLRRPTLDEVFLSLTGKPLDLPI